MQTSECPYMYMYMYHICCAFQDRRTAGKGRGERGRRRAIRRREDQRMVVAAGCESVGSSGGRLIEKRTIELVGNKLFPPHPPVCCRLLFIIWVAHGERCKCRKRPEESPCPLLVNDLVPPPIAHPPSLIVLDLQNRQGVDESRGSRGNRE
jgi:hypothetical protein